MDTPGGIKDVATEGYPIRHTAQFYDLFAGIKRRAARVLRVLPPAGEEAILDVGCGTGELACMVARVVGEKGRVAGIDHSARMLEIAQEEGRKARSCRGFPVGRHRASSFSRPHLRQSLFHAHDSSSAGEGETGRVQGGEAGPETGGKFLIVDFGAPSNAVVRALVSPIIFLEKRVFSGGDALESNLHGRVPDLLREAGFSRASRVAKDLGIIEYILAE